MVEAIAKKTATTEISHKLRLLNLLITFVVLSLLFVIMRYLYPPLQQVLNFIPDASMLAIVSIAIVLVATCLSLSWVLSRQVVRTIENYSDRLDSILTVTMDIRGEIHGDILLDKIMNCSLAITGSDAGSILLLDDNNLVFKIVKGTRVTELPGKAIPADTGIASWVLHHGQPVIIPDVKKDERYDPSIDAFTGYQTVSMLCVPLRTKSSSVGVIELLNKKQGPYDERDVEVISYLADQAAISIEKAQFYDDQRNYEIHLTDILLDVIDRFVSDQQGHSRRVAQYAVVMAKALNMTEERKRRLYFAGLLHDIGLLRISPDQKFEKEVYAMHPVFGYEMLSPINFYRDIAPHILSHHERYDGSGYPAKLSGQDIPLESRIIAIAEAFDSMVSRTSYKVPLTFELAVEELVKNRGGQFDPELVDLFVANVKNPLD
jgi:HD-GYP domain-containing protein (c-di-GMP phosphodiesterase class II)